MTRYIVDGGKLFVNCSRCRRTLRVRAWGSLHICLTNCELAQHHQAVRKERRGWLWRRSTWLVCDTCCEEEQIS